MSSNIPLNDLIESLAGAVIEAQDSVELHQLKNLTRYFHSDKRPKSLVMRVLPSGPTPKKANATSTAHRSCRSCP